MPYLPRRTWVRGQTPRIDVTTDFLSVTNHYDPPRLAFLVGAGVSVVAPTGLPTARRFLSELYRLVLPPDVDCSALSSPVCGPRFELVLDVLRKWFDRNLTVLQCFAGAEPNDNHRSLAALARQGAIVITTNFDVAIERALGACGPVDSRYLPQHFESAGPPAAEKMPAVWHLHGVIENHASREIDGSSIVASIGDLVKLRYQFELGGDKFGFLCRALDERDLVVVGYSGSDDYDITAALINVPGIRSVTWVAHSEESPPSVRKQVVSTFNGDEWFAEEWLATLAAFGEEGFPPPPRRRGVVADTRRMLGALAKVDLIASVESPSRTGSTWTSALAEWAARRFESTASKYHLALALSLACGLPGTERRVAESAKRRDGGGIEPQWAIIACTDAVMHGSPVAADWMIPHLPDVLRGVSVGGAESMYRAVLAMLQRQRGTAGLAELTNRVRDIQGILDQDPDPRLLALTWLLLAEIAQRDRADVASIDEVFSRAMRAAFDSGSHDVLVRTYTQRGIHLLKNAGEDDPVARRGEACAVLAEAFRLLLLDGDPGRLVQVASQLGLILDKWEPLRGLRAHAHALSAAAVCEYQEIQESAEEHIRGIAAKVLPDLEKITARGAELAQVILARLDTMPQSEI